MECSSISGPPISRVLLSEFAWHAVPTRDLAPRRILHGLRLGGRWATHTHKQTPVVSSELSFRTFSCTCYLLKYTWLGGGWGESREFVVTSVDLLRSCSFPHPHEATALQPIHSSLITRLLLGKPSTNHESLSVFIINIFVSYLWCGPLGLERGHPISPQCT